MTPLGDGFLYGLMLNPLLRRTVCVRSILITNSLLRLLFALATGWHDQQDASNPTVLIQTQDLPPVYEENSCLYIFTRENLIKRHHRIGEKPMMFEIDAAEAWDIDEELDFAITDFLLRRKNQIGSF
jgi:CMP-N-acetylneuraminic acid synthetase